MPPKLKGLYYKGLPTPIFSVLLLEFYHILVLPWVALLASPMKTTI